jgi:hypothetical protein
MTRDFSAGVYPMLPDETCWFLAADFDKRSWMQDVAAFRDTARAKGICIAIERSRSGNGAHAWIFFAEPIPVADARRLDVVVYDYVDENEPMLAKMAAKREAGYRSLGYRAVHSVELVPDTSRR